MTLLIINRGAIFLKLLGCSDFSTRELVMGKQKQSKLLSCSIGVKLVKVRGLPY